MGAKGFVLRVFTVAALATAVVIAAVIGAVLVPPGTDSGGDGIDAPPAHPEYDPATIDPDPIPATGSILAELEAEPGEEKQILIDTGHDNRVDRETLQPLVGALVNRGHEVRYLTKNEDMDGDLEAADAFIVVDPKKRYDDPELDRVEGFVANGGRLLILGEPNRKSISIGFGISVSTERSQVTELAGRFGMDIGTTYLHNMEHYDGTHEQVIVHPADGAEMAGVDRAVVDTAAPITAPDAEVVLRAAPGTNRSGIDEPAQYPVAVRDGGVMAVGDASLITPENVHVADNEAVAAGMIRFLTGGEKEPRDRPTRTASPSPSGTESGPDTPTPS
jgi:hypothetical protein